MFSVECIGIVIATLSAISVLHDVVFNIDKRLLFATRLHTICFCNMFAVNMARANLILIDTASAENMVD